MEVTSVQLRVFRLNSSSMDAYHVPTEILYQICEQTNDSRDLKAFRLANHLFASVSESFLFRTVRLFYHSARWTALNNIADTPRLARHVECIEIENGEDRYSCNQGLGSLALCCSDDGAWRQAYDSLVSCPRHHIGSTVQQTLDAIASFSCPPGDSFRMTKRWQDDGRYTMDAGGSPSLNLHKFPRLSKVETVHRADFMQLPYRDSKDKLASIDRQSLETRLEPWSGIQNNHLKVMMTAISRCNISLTRLSLHSTAEILDHVRESLSLPVHAALPNLLYLSITPPPEGRARQQYVWGNRRRPISIWSRIAEPASWLSSLRNLHTFEVLENPSEPTFYSLDRNFSVFGLLRDIGWPSLRTLRLKYIQSKVSDLRHFLLVTNRYRFRNLDELTIKEPRMDETGWNELRYELEKMQPGPARLELTPIMVEEPPVQMRWEQHDQCC